MTSFRTPTLRRRARLLSAVLSFATVAGVLLTAASALADCVAPPPHIWSYPGDGAENVPTDATLILAGRPSGVRLNGVVLTPDENGFSYKLGELDSGVEYTLDFDPSVAASAKAVTITFVTGDGPLPASGIVPIPSVSSAVCADIRKWQGCFDTGAPETVTLKPSSNEKPIAWGIVEKTSTEDYPVGIWPHACGDITVDTYSAKAEFEVVPLFADGPGKLQSTTKPLRDFGGCSLNPSSGSLRSLSGGWSLWLPALLALGFALLRRTAFARARRKRSH